MTKLLINYINSFMAFIVALLTRFLGVFVIRTSIEKLCASVGLMCFSIINSILIVPISIFLIVPISIFLYYIIHTKVHKFILSKILPQKLVEFTKPKKVNLFTLFLRSLFISSAVLPFIYFIFPLSINFFGGLTMYLYLYMITFVLEYVVYYISGCLYVIPLSLSDVNNTKGSSANNPISIEEDNVDDSVNEEGSINNPIDLDRYITNEERIGKDPINSENLLNSESVDEPSKNKGKGRFYEEDKFIETKREANNLLGLLNKVEHNISRMDNLEADTDRVLRANNVSVHSGEDGKISLLFHGDFNEKAAEHVDKQLAKNNSDWHDIAAGINKDMETVRKGIDTIPNTDRADLSEELIEPVKKRSDSVWNNFERSESSYLTKMDTSNTE